MNSSEVELGTVNKVYASVKSVDQSRADQDIEWDNVNFTVGTHEILKNCWGSVQAGDNDDNDDNDEDNDKDYTDSSSVLYSLSSSLSSSLS